MSSFSLPLGRSGRQNLLCQTSSRNEALSAPPATDEKSHGVISCALASVVLHFREVHELMYSAASRRDRSAYAKHCFSQHNDL